MVACESSLFAFHLTLLLFPFSLFPFPFVSLSTHLSTSSSFRPYALLSLFLPPIITRGSNLCGLVGHPSPPIFPLPWPALKCRVEYREIPAISPLLFPPFLSLPPLFNQMAKYPIRFYQTPSITPFLHPIPIM